MTDCKYTCMKCGGVYNAGRTDIIGYVCQMCEDELGKVRLTAQTLKEAEAMRDELMERGAEEVVLIYGKSEKDVEVFVSLRYTMAFEVLGYFPETEDWLNETKENTESLTLAKATEFEVVLEGGLVHFIDDEQTIRLTMYFSEFADLVSDYMNKHIYLKV